MSFLDRFTKKVGKVRNKVQETKNKISEISTKEQFDRQLESEDNLQFSETFGFLPLTDGCNVPELIQNIALAFDKNRTVCILDLDDYYPRMAKIFGVHESVSGNRGLFNLMYDETADIRDNLLTTKYANVYLLGMPSKLSITDMMLDDLDFCCDALRRIVTELKSKFGAVLINIPNHPFSELMHAGIRFSDNGFIVINQQVEWGDNYYKVRELTRTTLTGKGGFGGFTNVIVNNYMSIGDDFEAITKMDLNLVSIIPQVTEVIEYASEGRSYIGDAPDILVGYADAISKVVERIEAV